MTMGREAILAANCLPIEKVAAFGGEVNLRALSAKDQFQFEQEAKDQPNNLHRIALMAVYSIVDESGARLFTADDVPALVEKSIKDLLAVAQKSAELNGVGQTYDEAAAKN